MASNKGKTHSPAVELPKCPVCQQPMSVPIFLCQSGHSLCSVCNRVAGVLSPGGTCPICRQPMTQRRNRTLEEITEKFLHSPTSKIVGSVEPLIRYGCRSLTFTDAGAAAIARALRSYAACRTTTSASFEPSGHNHNQHEPAKVPCPHRAAGCVYAMTNAAVNDHVAECIFRQMECPLGAVFGKCSWTGQMHQIMEHFKQKHPDACDAGPVADADVELENVSLRECDRRLFLAAQHRLLFIITVKIDTIQRMAYWAVQHIGPKKQAHQHLYEIHVHSKRDPQRRVVFTERCFGDTVKVEEIIRQSNCATLPLNMLAHFIKDDKLSFRYAIRRVNTKPKPNEGEGVNSNSGNTRSTSCARENAPVPQKPRPKGPGYKGPGPNKNVN